MVDCPCHVSLQKKISMTHQQGTLKLYYLLLCTNVGDGILCALSTDHNIHGENGVSLMDNVCFEVKKCVGNAFPSDLET